MFSFIFTGVFRNRKFIIFKKGSNFIPKLTLPGCKKKTTKNKPNKQKNKQKTSQKQAKTKPNKQNKAKNKPKISQKQAKNKKKTSQKRTKNVS